MKERTVDTEYENLVITKAIEHIVEKYVTNQKVSINDETVYYICQIISIMGTSNNKLKIFRLISSRTKDAFARIRAVEYAEFFGEFCKEVKDKLREYMGFFDAFKRRRYLKKMSDVLYERIQLIDVAVPLISTYLVPFILENYSELF